MNRRKVLTYLLGASFIAGLTSKTLHKKSTQSHSNKNAPLSIFVGTWSFIESKHLNQTLTINEQGQLSIYGKPLNGRLTSINKNELVFTDHYGYELIIQQKEPETLTLYDSADEKEYTLTAFKEEKQNSTE